MLLICARCDPSWRIIHSSAALVINGDAPVHWDAEPLRLGTLLPLFCDDTRMSITAGRVLVQCVTDLQMSCSQRLPTVTTQP